MINEPGNVGEEVVVQLAIELRMPVSDDLTLQQIMVVHEVNNLGIISFLLPTKVSLTYMDRRRRQRLPVSMNFMQALDLKFDTGLLIRAQES